MPQVNNLEQQLYDMLISQGLHPEMLDRMGKAANTAADAKTFKFDYLSSSGKNYGTMVIIIAPDNEMQVMYGDNLGRAMEGEDKEEFFRFQQHLSKFARMHRYTYTAKDISQLKYSLQGLAAIQEGLFEGYYGNRKVSYTGEPTQARLMIRHNRTLGESDARYRYIESLFIETAEGERFRLPFTNLSGGKAMLEHVRQGGKPYDIRGNHIAQMVTEMKLLSRFNRASHGRVVEGVTAELVNGAFEYYQNLRESLKNISTGRGYARYFETWSPAEFSPQDQLLEDIKSLFIEQRIDSRIEDALPLLAKIQKESTAMKEVEIFETWADRLAEGTWALPDTPEQQNKVKMLLSKEFTAGPDGENATNALYDLVGDDQLFDIIDQAAMVDPDVDLRTVPEFVNRLGELGIEVPQADQPAEPAVQEADLPTYGESLGMAVVGEGSCNMTAEGEYCPEHGLAECGGYMEEGLPSHIKPSDLPPGMRPRLTMRDIEAERPQGAYRYRVGEKEFMNLGAAEEFAAATKQTVEPIREDDPMEYNAAVTSSFYESELGRIKKLALSK